MKELLRIRRGERLASLLFLVVILFFQYLIISKFWSLFSNYTDESFNQFMRNFHMSGFDPITYDVVTDWHQGYDVLRHPLLAFLMYPLFLVNKLLWTITGANCVQLVVGVVLTFCSFYSLIFIRRTLSEVIGVKPLYAILLSMFFLSFGYILIAMIVPDHFCLSLFFFSLTTYLAGRKMKDGTTFSALETFFLFTLTSGITLTNGAMVLAMIVLTNGRRFFVKKQLTFVGISLLLLLLPILSFSKANNEKSGESIISKQLYWTNDKVSRAEIFQENFFGESLQLHRKHLLGDVLLRRPVIVEYGHMAQNVVVIVIQLLFVVGMAIAWRNRFTWLLAGVFLFNLLLHIIMSFAIEEVYIMAAHWAFVIPLAIAGLMKTNKKWLSISTATVVALFTVYLFSYHGYLLFNYLTWPLVK